MSDVEQLQEGIKKLHGLEAVHAASVYVDLTFDENISWSGDVHVFNVQDLLTRFAYAWTAKAHGGESHPVVVLGIPPVNSIEAALRSHILPRVGKFCAVCLSRPSPNPPRPAT
jgi:hypothetical protein